MNEKKSFWNWIGLPDRSDLVALQDLLQIQSEQLARMEDENQRLRLVAERTKSRIGRLENALAFRQKSIAEKVSQEIREQIQVSAAEIAEKLDATRTETDAQIEKLFFADDKTYDALMKNARNQDELLRLLIVNTLQKELETTLDSNSKESKRKRTRKA